MVVSGVEEKFRGSPEKIGDAGLQGHLMPEHRLVVNKAFKHDLKKLFSEWLLTVDHALTPD